MVTPEGAVYYKYILKSNTNLVGQSDETIALF